MKIKKSINKDYKSELVCLFYWSVYKDGVIRGSIQKEKQIVQCVGAILFYFINLINKIHRVSISRHALC